MQQDFIFPFFLFFYGGLRTSTKKKQSKKDWFRSCLSPAPWQHRPQLKPSMSPPRRPGLSASPTRDDSQHRAKVTPSFPRHRARRPLPHCLIPLVPKHPNSTPYHSPLPPSPRPLTISYHSPTSDYHRPYLPSHLFHS